MNEPTARTAMQILTDRGANPRVDASTSPYLTLTIDVPTPEHTLSRWARTGTNVGVLGQSALVALERAEGRWPVRLLSSNVSRVDPASVLIDLLERDGAELTERQALAARVIEAVASRYPDQPTLRLDARPGDTRAHFTVTEGSENAELVGITPNKLWREVGADSLTEAVKKLL